MLPPRTPACPSDLALEQHLASPDAHLDAHARDCPHCSAWLVAAKASGEAWEKGVAPYALPKLSRALESERTRASRLIPLIASLAGAAAIALLVVWRLQPAGPELGVRGGGLVVHVLHQGDVRAASEGEQVRPKDSLRFTVAPKGARWVFVLSVDASGSVSRLAPAGEGPLQVASIVTLPGSAVLDEAPGPERVFAIFSAKRLAWSEVEAAARQLAASSPGAEGVRSSRTLPLEGVEQESVLLERAR